VRSGALLAWSRAKAGDVDRAQDLLEDARISQHPIGRWLSVWLAWKDKDNALALSRIEAMERDGHVGVPVALFKAQILDEDGNPDLAVKALAPYVKSGPHSLALFQKMKKLYEDNPGAGSMIELLEAWSLWDEHNPALREDLLNLRKDTKDFARARGDVARWMEIAPLDGQAWLDLANLNFGSKRDCAFYLQQLAIARGRAANVDSDSLLNEVECTWEQGQAEEARRLLREFRVLNPGHPRAKELRAIIQ